MADLLTFKRGEYASLPTTRVAGTVYITTDEQAMYVDLESGIDSSAKRIRIGETIQFDTVTDFQTYLTATEPPYDTKAFYYIVEGNALLKWVADGGDYESQGHWKQVNSTSEISADLTELKKTVSSHATNLASIGTPTGSGYLKNLQDAINTNATNISKKANQTEVDEISGKVTTNTNDISNLKDTVAKKADSSTVSSLNTTVAAIRADLGEKTATAGTTTAFGRIKTLEDKVATTVSQTEFSNLSTSVTDLQNTIGNKADKSTVDDLAKTVSSNSTTLATATGDIASIKTDLAKKASQVDFDALNNTVTNADTGLVSKVTALEENSATKSELQAVQGSVSSNATNIATNTSNIQANASKIADLEAAVGTTGENSLGSRVTALESTVNDATKGNTALKNAIGNNTDAASSTGSLYARIKKNVADISSLNTTLANEASNIDTLESLVGSSADEPDVNTSSSNGTLVQRIKKNANDITKLNNALTTTNATVSDNTKQINTNTSNITSLKSSVSSNATNISSLTTKVGNVGDASDAGTVYGAIAKNTEAIDNLEDTLLDTIRAANGMTYKGGVSAESGLPSTAKGVNVGDTYVATAGFTLTTDISGQSSNQPVYAGDLIIASGTTEEDSLKITSGLKWTVVNTGYIAAQESKLDVADNTIRLSSYTSPKAGDLGKVILKSDNLAISTNEETGEITLNAVWGTF